MFIIEKSCTKILSVKPLNSCNNNNNNNNSKNRNVSQKIYVIIIVLLKAEVISAPHMLLINLLLLTFNQSPLLYNFLSTTRYDKLIVIVNRVSINSLILLFS